MEKGLLGTLEAIFFMLLLVLLNSQIRFNA